MQDRDDNALLGQYVECGSEEAFAGLVTRHINKVHSVALRHTRNPHQAEEITQTVFVILARKARHLRKGVILSGWFYQTARLTAVTFLRGEMRRAHREHEAHLQATLNENQVDAWARIGSWLDAAMASLNELDRHAVVLRFFDGKSMHEVGTVLGASEEAAKKRVNRALEKMRLFFDRRGMVLSTSVIAAAVSANSVQAAPAALAKSVAAAGLAKGAASGISTVILLESALKFMAWTKLNLGIGTLLVAAVATTFVMQRQSRMKLFAENESLREHITQLQSENATLSAVAATPKRIPRVPAPRIQPAPAPGPAPANVSSPANLYARLLKDGSATVLTMEQLQPYLEANGRSAGSLLTAFRATGDSSLLREAFQKYPNDPQVSFAGAVSKDLSPEEHRQALDAFKKADPDNALANHLSALSYFNSGQSDQAVRELIAAAGKPQFDDYSKDFVQNATEAYLAAGYSTAEAKTLSTTGLGLPQLGDLRQLGQDMVSLAASYRQANDEPSAQATLQMAASLGQSYHDASSEQLAGQLVGMQIENAALNAMSPATPYGDPGQTVQDRLNQLAQQKASLSDLTRQIDPIMQNMSDQDWISFNDRLMIFGEEPAMRWLAQKHPTN